MTSEERFTRIENALSHSGELHVQHAEQMQRVSEEMQRVSELYKGVVVAIGKLAEGQRATDEKLNVLIDTVDRIIRDRGDQAS